MPAPLSLTPSTATTLALSSAASSGGGAIDGVVVVDGVGNGSTDDTAAIQAAITEAGTNGVVFFPPAPVAYLIATRITPLPGQTLCGPGMLKRSSGSTQSPVLCSGVANVTVDLVIDGNSSNNADQSSLVNISSGSTYVTVSGRLQNNSGPAVRIYDSSWCVSSADVYNCYYGVLIGSGGTAGDPLGVTKRNTVQDCRIDTVGKNGVFVTGRTDSGSSPNLVYDTRIEGVTIFQPGDTGIELGQGATDCVVTNVVIDGNSAGLNGILVRDGTGHSISNFRIKNFPMFSNGSGTFTTLGNGIYFWPQFTGTIKDCVVSNGVISNCSRGVYGQGNNSTGVIASPGGGAGTDGVVYAGIVLSNVTVSGTQLGTFNGASTMSALACHGFYIQSVSGWILDGCVAKNCQNDGFRIGDNGYFGSYVTETKLTGCSSFNNGQQALAGQTYYGYYLAGSPSQKNIRLVGCTASDFQVSHTQHYGFGWNDNGVSGQTGAAFMSDCSGGGNATGLFLDMGGVAPAPTNSIVTKTANYSIGVSDWLVVVTANSPTITLPSATFIGLGKQYLIRNAGAGSVTVAASGAATVHTTTLAAGAEHLYVTDGSSNWW